MLSQIVKVGADATGFQRVVAGTAAQTGKLFKGVTDDVTKRFGNLFTGAAMVQGFTRIAGAVVDTVDQIKDLADQLDLSTEEVQKLQLASERAAVRINVVGAALRAIEDMRAAAQTGDKRAVGIFAALGIDPTKGTSLDIMQAALAQAQGGAEKQNAIFSLIGRKANQLRNVMAEMHRLGPIRIIDQESLDAFDKANNALKDLYRETTKLLAEPAGFWARVLQKADTIEDERTRAGKSSVNLYSRIVAGTLQEIFGGTAGGVDLSALPMPMKNKGNALAASANAETPTALPLATQADAFARIGLFVGGRATGDGALVRIGNAQLTTLRQIKSAIEEANR
jgi:hypothetical protein